MVQNSENHGLIVRTSAPTLALVWVMSQSDAAHAVRPTRVTLNKGIIASTADARRVSSSAAPPRIQAGDIDGELREPEVLNDLFAEKPEVYLLVREAAHELGRAFGNQAKIVVEPYFDPEAAGAEPRVFVVAVTGLPFEQADQILDSVLEGWWVDNQGRANYLVSLATELV